MFPVSVGRTQASSVMPDVRSSDGLSAIVTYEPPSNDSADPERPATYVARRIVPSLPLPLTSLSTLPDPSSKS